MEWQPIETAPIGQDVITLAETIFPWNIECKNSNGEWERNNPKPIYWMPLPEPPK